MFSILDSSRNLRGSGLGRRLSLILGVAGLALGASVSRAANFSPTTPAEFIADMETANANGEADAFDLGGLTFTFSAAYNSTDQALPQLVGDGDLTFNGNGAVIERDPGASDLFRFFLNESMTPINVTLNDITFRGGRLSDEVGAAIQWDSAGSLTINRCVFENNAIMGLDSSGAALHFGEQGLDGAAPVGLIRDSLFRDNWSNNSSGAILVDDATLTLVNCTFTGNRAKNTGGAIGLVSSRDDVEGVVNLFHCTIANNAATLGAALGTQRGASGNLEGAPAFNLSHTVIANNFGLNAIQKRTLGGMDSPDNVIDGSGGYNIIDDADFAFDVPGPGNQIGVEVVLGALADNGGAFPTHALGASSPAIDAGDPAFDPMAFSPPLDNDLRGMGFPRSAGAGVDIGAHENDETDVLRGSINLLGDLPHLLDFGSQAWFFPVRPGAPVEFEAVFTEPVSGVDASDFALNGTGTLAGFAITGVSALSADRYLVSASTGAGEGLLSLTLADDNSIASLADGGFLGGAAAGDGDFSSAPYHVTVFPAVIRDGDVILKFSIDGSVPGSVPGTPATELMVGETAVADPNVWVHRLDTFGPPLNDELAFFGTPTSFAIVAPNALEVNYQNFFSALGLPPGLNVRIIYQVNDTGDEQANMITQLTLDNDSGFLLTGSFFNFYNSDLGVVQESHGDDQFDFGDNSLIVMSNPSNAQFTTHAAGNATNFQGSVTDLILFELQNMMPITMTNATVGTGNIASLFEYQFSNLPSGRASQTFTAAVGINTVANLSQPLSVELESFEATASGPFMPAQVKWTTSAEIDNVGFYVHRAERSDARSAWTVADEPLNAELIPGRGGPDRGAEYSFTDSAPARGRERAYFLTDIDQSGRETLHGPAFATIGRDPSSPVPAQAAPVQQDGRRPEGFVSAKEAR